MKTDFPGVALQNPPCAMAMNTEHIALSPSAEMVELTFKRKIPELDVNNTKNKHQYQHCKN